MRRTLALVLGVGLGLLLAGCGNDRLLPVEPTAPAPVSARFPDDWPGEPWNLQLTLTAIEGRVPCWAGTVGRTFEWWLAVERSDGGIRLRVGNVDDYLDLTGPLTGDSFAARSPSYSPAVGSCVEPGRTTTARYSAERAVSGQFSEDGRALVAAESVTYRAEGTGDTIVLRLDWEGTRR